ncbi:ABC-type transport system involved in multi-copper enzyme maturation permease subunit [Ereboglobus sp. PH5-10]|uniref:hypothetical protein n=1 Tax=Ereboglobus sp. PH5-10 TaxID=2940629 RepID=UPI002405CE45|nr:hypothetical protein [Ereboglobus sp. PH5-10]MDF9827480.1 ABC-type transport system involved in multi-copper enzyme maturation permease subunit [Ereboglobus sp. PH5-10]
MNVIRAFVYRDLRRFALLILLWMVAAFIYFAHNFLDGAGMHMVFLGSLTWVMWVSFVSLIVHDAPPSGTSEFWMTRPVSGAQLFLSKFIVVVLFCAIAPILSLSMAKICGFVGNGWFHDAKNAQAIVLLFPQLLVIALALMLVASLTRNTLQYIVSLFLTGFGVTLLSALAPRQTALSSMSRLQYSDLLKWLLAAVATAGMVAIIYNQYKHRNRLATIGLAILLGLTLIGIWQSWPSNSRG